MWNWKISKCHRSCANTHPGIAKTMDQSIWIGNYQLFGKRYSLDRFGRREKVMAVWSVLSAPCHEPQTPFTVTSPRLQRRLISLHPIAIHENDADICEALTPSLWKKSVSALIRCIIQVFQFLKPTLTCQR